MQLFYESVKYIVFHYNKPYGYCTTAGETIDRNYDWSKFTKSSLYGAPTPNDPTGKQVKTSLHWLTQAQRSVR